MPTPPRPIARPGGSSGGRSGVDAGLAEARRQPGRADGVEQAHGRHVERQLQRLPDADVALVAHVEIARPVAGEVGRAILDQRFLRDQPLLDGQAIDERFQRRAGRAARSRSCRSSRSGWRRRNRPSRPRRGSRRSGRRPSPWRPTVSGRASWRLRAATASSPSWTRLLIVSWWTRSAGALRSAALGGMRRQAPAGRGATAATLFSRGARRPRAGRAGRRSPCGSSTRSRAACAPPRLRSGRRRSGNCGRATSRAASDSVSRFGSLPK